MRTLLVALAASAVSTAATDDDYMGTNEPALPVRGLLKSVRGLHQYIRNKIPGHTAEGVVDGMTIPLTRTNRRKDMLFLKFDTHEKVSIEDFRDAVHRHEKDILATPLRPGLVGLDKASTMTSRSDRYNVFFWEEPWVGDYFWLIKRAFHQYIEAYDLKKTITKPMYIHSWANCLRKGQKLEWHNHGEEGDFQISGTFAVSTSPGSATLYKIPGSDKIMRNPNKGHDLVMFDSMIDHQTTTVDTSQLKGLNETAESNCRITSSWDINEEPGTVWHSVPFYDPEDPYFTNDPTGTKTVRMGQEVLKLDQTEEEIEALQINPKAKTTRWGAIEYGTLEEAQERGPLPDPGPDPNMGGVEDYDEGEDDRGEQDEERRDDEDHDEL